VMLAGQHHFVDFSSGERKFIERRRVERFAF